MNEKTIVGFIALMVMVLVMIVDLVTGTLGKDLVVKEFIYDSFTIIVLGSFGIAGLEKFGKRNNGKKIRILSNTLYSNTRG